MCDSGRAGGTNNNGGGRGDDSTNGVSNGAMSSGVVDQFDALSSTPRRHTHHSFLEELAKQECQAWRRRRSAAVNEGEDSDDEDDENLDDDRNLHLLDVSSSEGLHSYDDDDSDEFSSDEDFYSEDENGGDDGLGGADAQEDGESVNRERGHVIGGVEDEIGENDYSDASLEPDGRNGEEGRGGEGGNNDALLGTFLDPAVEDESNAFSLAWLRPYHHYNNPTQNATMSRLRLHPCSSTLLCRLARSEECPLIRADVSWSTIGDPFECPLPRSYPAVEVGDERGSYLLQGMLRMDPPLEAVKRVLDAFPRSCLDMEGFFTACQFSHSHTSRRRRRPTDGGAECGDTATGGDSSDDDDDEDDVGGVVKLVMDRTILARKCWGIKWGMVAFLGDARINASHAKLLLRSAPAAVSDEAHGTFGVSPLHRMASGVFIHGDSNVWVSKLRLALRTAAFVEQEREKRMQSREEEKGGEEEEEFIVELPKRFFQLDLDSSSVVAGKPLHESLVQAGASEAPLQAQYPPPSGPSLRNRKKGEDMSDASQNSSIVQTSHPYHELIRLLVSPTFRGNKFGDMGFLHTLAACTKSDPAAFRRTDDEGNLPLHVALRTVCGTVWRTKGERRLIRYLLELDQDTALFPEGGGRVDSRKNDGGEGGQGRTPLRMSIENAWPVYDLIVNAALSAGGSVGGPYAALAHAAIGAKMTLRDDGAGDADTSKKSLSRPLLHQALDGPYHERFGINGARFIIKKIITKISYGSRELSGATLSSSHLTRFVDDQGCTALHVALENRWPVYDLLLKAFPAGLEARDPTRLGFFPYQIAACAFTASFRRTEPKAETTAGGDGHRGDSCQRDSEVEEENKVALMELGMLFELIRESPLSVALRISNGRQPTLYREGLSMAHCSSRTSSTAASEEADASPRWRRKRKKRGGSQKKKKGRAD